MRDSESTGPGPSAPATRLRILCLHGYHGSAATLRSQMRSLATGLESLADFVCVDAPSLAEGDFGWWHAVDRPGDPDSDDPGVSARHKHYKGWLRTRSAVIAWWSQQGPFDGVFGFSQGAALTGLLVGLRSPGATPTAERPLRFDFAMMVGGFESNDPTLAALYANRASYDLPSLHLLGRSDGIVSPANSRSLAARFRDPVVVEHDGGHVIASDPAVRDRVRSFLQAMLARRSAASAASPASAAASVVPPGVAAGPETLPLWPGRSSPTLRVVLPEARPGALAPALIVLRGGAYATSMGSGSGTVEWAARHGMVGFEVPYRTQGSGDSYPRNYADAARAVRLVREHAARWGVDPARVGVLGYSAGGHLASLLSTQPTLHLDPDDDLAPRVSARPDFLVLGYPVISFVADSPGSLAGSAENFVGRRDIDDDTRRRFSNELHVAAGHPPVFLWTTADDALVPATHSRLFAEACERARVPVTFRLYPHGRHGLGLALDDPGEVRAWSDDLLAWLAARGLRAPAP